MYPASMKSFRKRKDKAKEIANVTWELGSNSSSLIEVLGMNICNLLPAFHALTASNLMSALYQIHVW